MSHEENTFEDKDGTSILVGDDPDNLDLVAFVIDVSPSDLVFI